MDWIARIDTGIGLMLHYLVPLEFPLPRVERPWRRRKAQRPPGGVEMIRVLGIIGIVVGLGMIIATATHAAFAEEPSRGYIVGTIFAVAGVFRFIRGTNR
jgi:hypothetical protein